MLFVVLGANSAQRRELAGQKSSIDAIGQQIQDAKQSQDKFGLTVDKSLQTNRDSLDKHLLSNKETINKLYTQIGELSKSSEQMLNVGDDVRKLQDIFKNPKFRGQTGERSLEKMLGEILPKDSFKIQHTFKNGKIVDALIQMQDYSVPVDAKFPLPAFEKMLTADTDQDRAKLRRLFQDDVIKHIDKIAASYIHPEEGTLDFALMYIPAENVYYETVIQCDGDKKDVAAYALEKKVIAISPNLLYVYLMTIVMGLHGMQIEKKASQIRQSLKKLDSSVDAFADGYGKLGRHLRHAQSQFDDGEKRLNKFTLQLGQIQSDGEDG
jgi:DNA recombination protein RmuC